MVSEVIKKFFILILSLLFSTYSLAVSSVFAKEAEKAPEAIKAEEALPAPEAFEAPEADGVYEVPNRPGLKVQVFVHKQKQKAAKAITPSLVCNLSDPNSNAVIPAAGWHLVGSTWTYRLNVSSVPSSVGASDMPTIASNAFGAWQSAIGGKINLLRGADTGISRSSYDGQNVIAWGRTSSRALAVTYTWFYSSSGQVVEEDTIFNSRVAWEWSSSPNCAYPNYYDAQDILTHEIGHWMGLDDTYDLSYADNTMYGYGSKAEVKKNTLTSGDVAGVLAIYP